MLKNKLKIALIFLAILVFISTLSFATETTAEDVLSDPDASLEDILAAYQSEENGETETTGDAEAVYSTNNSIEENWVNDDLYKIDEKVEINQIVDGNVYVMAKEVVINSEIGGNVYVMAEKITIGEAGYIYSSLYAMGKEITIDGIVCDAYVMAGNISIGNNGYIYRDLRASGNEITLNGKVRRNAYLSVNELNLNAENGSLIGGNLTYSSKNEATIPEGAVSGETTFNKEIEDVKTVNAAAIIGSYVYSAISFLVYIVVVILLATWLAPKFVEKVKDTETKNALISLVIGLGTPIAGIIVGILLLITGIAAKVGIALFMVIALIWMSAMAITSIYLGNIVAKKLQFEGKAKFVLACILTALAIWLVAKIPVLGSLVSFVATILGIGLFVYNIFAKKVVEKENTEVAEVSEIENKEK